MYNIKYTIRRASINRVNKLRKSRNQRTMEINYVTNGIEIPNNIRKTLKLDIENKNHLWDEAVMKELKNLDMLNYFEYYHPNIEFQKWKNDNLHHCK